MLRWRRTLKSLESKGIEMNQVPSTPIKKAIRVIKQFIKKPSAGKAVRMVRSRLNGGLEIYMCDVANDKDRFCFDCVWDPVCQVYEVKPDDVTDEEVSAMVLDAMEMLARYEAEHA